MYLKKRLNKIAKKISNPMMAIALRCIGEEEGELMIKMVPQRKESEKC